MERSFAFSLVVAVVTVLAMVATAAGSGLNVSSTAQQEEALAGVQQFIERHVVGKAFCRSVTRLLDNGKLNTTFSSTVWYSAVKRQPPFGFTLSYWLKISQTIAEVSGGVSGAPKNKDRTLRACMQFAVKLSTSKVTGMRYICDENGAPIENYWAPWAPEVFTVDFLDDQQLKLHYRDVTPFVYGFASGDTFRPLGGNASDVFSINKTTGVVSIQSSSTVYPYDIQARKPVWHNATHTSLNGSACQPTQQPPNRSSFPMEPTGAARMDLASKEYDFLKDFVDGKSFVEPVHRFNITSQGVQSTFSRTVSYYGLRRIKPGFVFNYKVSIKQTNEDIRKPNSSPRVEDRVSVTRCLFTIFTVRSTTGVCYSPVNEAGVPLGSIRPSTPGGTTWPFYALSAELQLRGLTKLEFVSKSAWPYADLYAQGPKGFRPGIEASNITFELIHGKLQSTRVVQGFDVNLETFEATKTDELPPRVAVAAG